MIRTIVSLPKADWDQHLSAAIELHSKGLTAAQTVAWFKSARTTTKGTVIPQYSLHGLRFEATRVSAMIAGIEVALQPPVVEETPVVQVDE